ncbi:15677_t:CDS:2 [Dentiscutata erythropus]|uniref:15677_t:CDS:1 n=1 Tax=Dentiscutata erythropus TaxID=1348616 RepID=A0A9N8VZ88_9GLOM|nr:15677_t:CDS:2 [Dentiscutata erythropus]
MSSVFVSFCFVKTISASEKFLTGSALYRVNNENDKFREFTFKGFTATPETLIADFEKNSIVLMIGHYVYEDTEYLTLIQTVPISFFANDTLLTPKDLLYASPLLLFSAPILQNSFLSLDGNKECFILTKRLYNGVNNHKNIETKITVSYDNSNNRYDIIKNNIKKTVMSVIGQLKIGKKNTLHIIASDIKWNYASIEEKYTAMNSLNKRQRVNLTSTSRSNSSRETVTTMNFMNTVAQVKNGISSTHELVEESTNQEVIRK